MFEFFFGLSENPFNLTPDPKFLYMSDVHKEALSHLQFGIEQRKGFVLITGEVGTGKTTLCRSLLSMLSNDTRTALILNPSLSDVELLQTINQDFGISYSSDSKKVLLDKLYDFLIEVFIQGDNAVLIIDECQNLTPDVLEQIRMLSNLETEKEKLLQIVMIGQPELAKMLEEPALRQINDRITLRYHIWPLNFRDTRNYLRHRLSVAGAFRTDIFTSLAVRSIYRYSHGLPRKMNAIAERALLIAYLKGRHRVGRSCVTSAIRELKGNYGTGTRRLRYLLPLSAGVLAGAALLVAFWPGVFTRLADYTSTPVIATPVAEPGRDGQRISGPPVMPVRAAQVEYVIPHYEEAIELLGLLPEGLQGPEVLNLHPQPPSLKHLRQPAIVSVERGYLILVHASDDFVRVVGRDRALLEIPMKDFRDMYKWNLMISYSKGPEDFETYTRGDSGPGVERIQDILARIGYTADRTGFFDITTACSIEQMQEDFGLKKDGVAGQETMVLLSMLEKEPQ